MGLGDLPLQGEVLRARPPYVGSTMNDPEAAAMSHKSIVRAVLLLVLVAALGSGTHDAPA